jgi:hypothetical protein
MSRAIASARQRRAGVTQEIPPPPIQQQQTTSQQGLTLPQVISVVDARLIKLEKFMNEFQTNQSSSQQKQPQQSQDKQPQQQQPQQQQQQQPQYEIDPNIIDEFQSRFDLLAQELMNLKDIVLKLQSYTMDVNKMLLDERIPIENNEFYMENNLDESEEDVVNDETVRESE